MEDSKEEEILLAKIKENRKIKKYWKFKEVYINIKYLPGKG